MATTAWDVYRIYRCIKFHFETDYDCFKYNFKSSNIKLKLFLNSKGLEAICKYISYRYTNEEELKQFIFANYIKNNQIDLVFLHKEKELTDKTYSEFRRKQESLGYIFKQDITKLFESVNDITTICKCMDTEGMFGNYPEILVQTKEELINIETLIIMDDIMNLFDYWNIRLDLEWITYRKYVDKYRKFIQYDKKRMKEILKDLIGKYK